MRYTEGVAADRIGRLIGWAVTLGLVIYAILTTDGSEWRTLRAAAPILAALLILAWLLNRKLNAILEAIKRR